MSIGKLLLRVCASARPVRKKRSASASAYHHLEARHLLAGIFFDGGEITIAGDQFDNVGSAEVTDGGLIQANLEGHASQTFDPADVDRINFLGFGGDDQFSNNTSTESLQIGGNGNDTLTGGSVFDQINGGNGNDTLRGGDGNDRLIAGFGDDHVFGGLGNDTIFGSADTNRLDGENGDDIIFGGDQVDTIFGGTGIDQIFGLGGDDIIDVGDGGVAGTAGIGQADFVLGLGGNDTIRAGTGLNVLYGGDGNDTLIGGNGENRLHGQKGNDALTGGNNNDYLAGGEDDDVINALDGADFIIPGRGVDTVDGGAGTDKTVFPVDYQEYRIHGDETLTVKDMRDISGSQDFNTITTMERFVFSDGERAAESPILEVVTIQPIVVSDDDGSGTATFFGTASQEYDIKSVIDDIFYQAYVDVEWETPTTWNNTFANRGNGGTRPTSDLSRVTSDGDTAGVGNSDPLILDMYFVEVAAGFGSTSKNTANGLAFVFGNGITIHVGDNLPGSNGGRRLTARVAAHEIAHNLGLFHEGSSDNLMRSGTNLTESQIDTILDSRYTVPVSDGSSAF